MQDGITECDSYTLYAEDNIGKDVWTCTFKNVLQEDDNGNVLSYTVVEEPIDGYTSTNVTSDGNSWSITNKYVPEEPEDPDPGTEPDPGTNPTPGTPPTYQPSGTNPAFTVVTYPKEPDKYEAEDVSSNAGFFDEEFDAVRRDDIMILILVGIIITGTLILVFRHNSDKSDGKYHM